MIRPFELFFLHSQRMWVEQWRMLSPMFEQTSPPAICVCLSYGTRTAQGWPYMYCARGFPPFYQVRMGVFLIEKPFNFRSNPITTIFGSQHSGLQGCQITWMSTTEYRSRLLISKAVAFYLKSWLKCAPYQLMGYFNLGIL